MCTDFFGSVARRTVVFARLDRNRVRIRTIRRQFPSGFSSESPRTVHGDSGTGTHILGRTTRVVRTNTERICMATAHEDAAAPEWVPCCCCFNDIVSRKRFRRLYTCTRTTARLRNSFEFENVWRVPLWFRRERVPISRVQFSSAS